MTINGTTSSNITAQVEQWKSIPIAALAGVEVSSAGRVRGIKGATTINQGYERFSHDGIQYAVHRLVCLAFHGAPPIGKDRALHWNDEKLDNRAINLRWGSALDNAEDAKRNGIVSGPLAWRTRHHIIEAA